MEKGKGTVNRSFRVDQLLGLDGVRNLGQLDVRISKNISALWIHNIKLCLPAYSL